MRSSLFTILKKSIHQAIQNVQHPAAAEMTDEQIDNAITSRRTALKQIGLGGTGLLLSQTPVIGQILSSMKNPPKIAILGGGVAGLNCCYQLQRQGIHAQVFEASQRAGGRIFSLHDRFGKGLNTEAGGEFLDSSHADMLGLAEHFGLKTLDVTMDNHHFEEVLFVDNHIKYSQAQFIEGFKAAVPEIIADRTKCGVDYDTPFAQELDNMGLDTYIRKLSCESWVAELLITAYVGEYGLDGHDQSALNFISLIGFPENGRIPLFGDSDERYKVIGGNAQIIYKLAEQVGDKINYGKSVAAIVKKSNKYIIAFNDGTDYIADMVVCTIPFTLLRNIKLQGFQISPEKQKCINELGYGTNNKLLLGIQQRIWRQGARPCLGYTYSFNLHTAWDNSHMQNDNKGPSGFTVFLGGTPSLNLASKSAVNNNMRVLTDADLKPYLTELNEIYEGFVSNYSGSHEVIIWSGNPYSKGSYACYKPGQWQTIAGYEFEPLDANFLFAGEHCSSDFQGFMNGAAETGRICAETILQKVLKPSKK